MGCYVNPDNESKEKFLLANGYRQILNGFTFDRTPENCLPIIWVNNGPFTAAGVCYSESEFRAFTMPDDKRYKELFIVEIDKLYEVSNLDIYLPRNK